MAVKYECMPWVKSVVFPPLLKPRGGKRGAVQAGRALTARRGNAVAVPLFAVRAAARGDVILKGVRRVKMQSYERTYGSDTSGT